MIPFCLQYIIMYNLIDISLTSIQQYLSVKHKKILFWKYYSIIGPIFNHITIINTILNTIQKYRHVSA